MNKPAIQDIKERLDIAEFIRQYVESSRPEKISKRSARFTRKTPSFMISPERQSWHCFGSCSEGGDVFKFLMKYENLEFHEALKVLAEKAGVELKKTGYGDQREYDVLYEINTAAKDFFINQLKQSKEGLDYLKERGLKEETIERFGLGFAGAAPDNLTVYLIKAGYDIKDVVRAGLAVRSERGLNFDRFRGRLMFPLFNHYGKTVGFTGRILERLLPSGMELAKYVNSPETPIFNKSRVLYGFHETKGDIRKKNEAVLIEGQMDFLMGWQEGARNLAAVSGTALSADHLKTLRRAADVLTFCFDNDEAGRKRWNGGGSGGRS